MASSGVARGTRPFVVGDIVRYTGSSQPTIAGLEGYVVGFGRGIWFGYLSIASTMGLTAYIRPHELKKIPRYSKAFLRRFGKPTTPA